MNNMKPINAFLISLLTCALPFCNAIAAGVKFLEKGEKKFDVTFDYDAS